MTTNYTLTVVDTVGIQSYLFSTNNLRQNAGASHLVTLATGRWVQDALPTRHNVKDIEEWRDPFDEQTIDNNSLAAEVIYAGGGKALILFANAEGALTFARTLSKRVMLEAPGLRLAIVHKHGFDWARTEPEQMLGGKTGWVAQLMDDLSTYKKSQMHDPPTLGLGVTADCVFTSMPVVAYDEESRPISAESKAKLNVEPHARIWQRKILFEAAAEQSVRNLRKYGLPAKFEDLGGTHGDSSYIALVHADGNGMGKRFEAVSARNAQDNRAYITATRTLSLSLNQAAIQSFAAAVAQLESQITTKHNRKHQTVHHINHQVELSLNGSEPMLPLRPLILGGDDLTFVCDGRLGISLAAIYLEQMAQQKLSDGKMAFCRAGVAVVHSHYPFTRAYELAVDMCDKTAKKAVKEAGEPCTVLDWHFAVTGPIRPLSEIRRREYTSDSRRGSTEDAGDLLMRPLYIGTRNETTDRNSPLRQTSSIWENFRNVAVSFQEHPDWIGRRNKVITLREALREGGDAVEFFRLASGLPRLPELDNTDEEMRQTGWHGGRCAYFDPIEALDHFIDLNPKKRLGDEQRQPPQTIAGGAL